MLILLFVFMTLVAYHARLVEVTSRLDFLWKRDAQRELAEMRETRRNNRQLLRNILPDHVANHFLNQDRQAEVSNVRANIIKDINSVLFFCNQENTTSCVKA